MTEKEIIEYLKNNDELLKLVSDGFTLTFDDPKQTRQASQLLIEKVAKNLLEKGRFDFALAE